MQRTWQNQQSWNSHCLHL